MFIPEGMTEAEVLADIDSVVNLISYSFKFSYYDTDDMRQQGRMYAIEALSRYNPKLGSLPVFLRSHVRNRFLNLHRDKLSRNQPPCTTCPFYDPDCAVSKNECSAFVDKLECDKWASWEKRNRSKRSLAEPLDISGIRDEKEPNMRAGSNIEKIVMHKELMLLFDIHLPINLRSDFKRILEDVSISKARRDKVLDALRLIMEEHYNGETW